MIFTKREVVTQMLRSGVVRLVVNGKHPGVKVPEAHRTMPLVLDIGHEWALEVPILDFLVDDEGISGTLSFSRTPHVVMVPWGALLIAVQGDQAQVAWPSTDAEAPEPKRGGLSLVKS